MENGEEEAIKDKLQVSNLDHRVSAKAAQEIQNEPHVWATEERGIIKAAAGGSPPGNLGI